MNSQNQRVEFIQQAIHSDDFTCEAITSDASFRRYYRVTHKTMTWILMETPVDKLDNAPFIGLNTVFAEQGLNVPQILANDEEHGLLLLQDLGSEHLSDRLVLPSRLDDYRALIALIPDIAKTPKSEWMKPYDAEFINMELNIFYEWLVTKWLGLTPTEYQQVQWHNVKLKLVDAMTRQPQVTMHRDFHSRNLICHQSQWYLIDYQDAVQGPVTYDAVSLLRDCYTRLDAHEFTELQQHSFDCLKAANLLGYMDFSTYQHCFDLTGMQRHLKAAGIFTRLLQRDGKGGYVENILPTLRYLFEVANKYKEFQWLASWLENDIMPQAQAKLGKK